MTTSDDVSMAIVGRFYQALDAIIAKNELRGVATYCRLYGINRRYLLEQRKGNEKRFQLYWLYPMVKNHHVNAQWLIVGSGPMFVN